MQKDTFVDVNSNRADLELTRLGPRVLRVGRVGPSTGVGSRPR
jgi:hypothetical protein